MLSLCAWDASPVGGDAIPCGSLVSAPLVWGCVYTNLYTQIWRDAIPVCVGCYPCVRGMLSRSLGMPSLQELIVTLILIAQSSTFLVKTGMSGTLLVLASLARMLSWLHPAQRPAGSPPLFASLLCCTQLRASSAGWAPPRLGSMLSCRGDVPGIAGCYPAIHLVWHPKKKK